MSITELSLPDIGDFSDVEVIEVLVSEGDTIEAEQSLITVESEKASMEIPASSGGVVKSIKVSVGDKVKEGSVILVVEPADAAGGKSEPKAESAGSSGKPAQDASQGGTKGASGKAGAARVIPAPDIGGSRHVAVPEVLVTEGDTVEADQSLITVESEKASMEVPSSHAGVV